jgi:uncharacterized membrane protein HdeD (DUF308 family)
VRIPRKGETILYKRRSVLRYVVAAKRYDRGMKPWAIAAAAILIVTIAILAASPSWVFQGCNDAAGGSNCGGIPPLIIGFVGVAAAAVLLFIGALRSIR